MKWPRRITFDIRSVYMDTSKPVGDPNQLFVFASREGAHEWLEEFDPEGVAFEYHVFGTEPASRGGG